MRALLSAVLSLVVVGAAWADGQNFDRIERGRYLTVLGDCAACHTRPGGPPFAGGFALETPFGKIVVPNITPDRDTGIGGWTDQEFIAALRDGLGPKAHLYPAMPYPAYTKMTDEDVLAIRAYLDTLAPVNYRRGPNGLPFPLNIRQVMVFWNALNFAPGRYQPNPQKSVEWNRGAYIVEGAAHCGTCHTPKTILGGDKSDRLLEGATLQGWFAPDITSNPRKGIGGWSEADLVQYLKTGANNWTLASGPMADAITHSTSRMTNQDIAAIATYLKDSGITTSAATSNSIAPNEAVMRAGAAIYKDSCAACHKDSGNGEAHLFPRLAGSALVQSDDPTTLVRVVLQGTRAASTAGMPTAPAMPAFDWRLNDEQVAAVLTFIRNSWKNSSTSVASSTVTSGRASLASGP